MTDERVYDTTLSFNVIKKPFENDTRELGLSIDRNIEDITFCDEKCKESINGSNYIARGSYASIYRLSDKHSMKVCNSSQYNLLDLTVELYILSQLSHSSLLYCDHVIKHKRSIIFILPYFANNLDTLYPRTHEHKESVMKQLASAVNYLHSKQILHLDICPKNILTRQVGDEFHAVLCDFSLSVVSNNDNVVSSYSRITIDHRPYENLRGSKRYSKKSDIWSLGIVFYKILHEKYLIKFSTVPCENPIAFDYELSTRFEIEQLQSWGRWPPTNNEIIVKMLDLDIQTRIDSYEICNLLNISSFQSMNLVSGNMTLKKRWMYVSNFFKKIDTMSLKQVELLFTNVMQYMTNNNISINEKEKDNFFLTCYAVVKSCTNDISHININNASSVFNRVFEIFEYTKGNFLSFIL